MSVGMARASLTALPARNEASSEQASYAASCSQVMEQMPNEALEFLKAELDFFDRVTDISGELYPVPKDERKTGAVALAKQVRKAELHSAPKNMA